MTEIMVRKKRNRPKKKLSLEAREALSGWFFVSPALIGFSIFTFAAIGYSLYLSLTQWDLLSTPRLIGLQNFINIFTADKYFYKYMGNTVYFVLFLVPIVLVISLMLAVIINKRVKGIVKAYRAILFLPSITSTVAISMVWIWILNPEMGLINNFLRMIGFQNTPLWLSSESSSKMALIIMRTWQMSGYYMLIFLAGLQTVPTQLYEAASIDGAGPVKRFFAITLPMLSNTTFVVMILLIIEAFNMFESVFIMTSGGPLGSTRTIMYYIYEQAFTNYNMGYASALAWILFLIILIVTLIQYRFRKEQEGE